MPADDACAGASRLARCASLAPSVAPAAGALERLTGLYDQSTQTILNRRILGRQGIAP